MRIFEYNSKYKIYFFTTTQAHRLSDTYKIYYKTTEQWKQEIEKAKDVQTLDGLKRDLSDRAAPPKTLEDKNYTILITLHREMVAELMQRISVF